MSTLLLFSLVALASSACWALGAVLWTRLGTALTAGGMSFAKVTLGCALLAPLVAAGGAVTLDARGAVYLSVSGVLGIAVGDTLFFLSLSRLGPRLASLVGCLNPVAIALASLLVLGERPETLVWAGILVAGLGVTWVLRERSPGGGERSGRGLGVSGTMKR